MCVIAPNGVQIYTCFAGLGPILSSQLRTQILLDIIVGACSDYMIRYINTGYDLETSMFETVQLPTYTVIGDHPFKGSDVGNCEAHNFVAT